MVAIVGGMTAQSMTDPKETWSEIAVTDLTVPSSARVPPDTRCEVVYHMFSVHPHVAGLAVIEDDRPVGLVERTEFLLKFGWQYGWSLYAKHPITRLMDPDPMIVEDGTDARTILINMLADHEDAVRSGYIVAHQGRFLRIETTTHLLRRLLGHMQGENRRLREERTKAEYASRAKSRFLASMSHELRTPLNAIIGFAQLLQEHKILRLDDDKISEYAHDISDSGELLLSLINDILDLTKLEAGKTESEPMNNDARALLETCVRLARPSGAKRGVEIERIDLEGAIYADPRQTSQIVINLLSNALKFSPVGGTVTLATEVRDDEIDITVRDRGPGVPDEDRERIFNPFEQIDGRDGIKPSGTGLGLAIVRQLVDANHGRIRVDEAAGGGALFTVTLKTNRVAFESATRQPDV